MKYENSIFNGLKVMAKVKVFVYAANADADPDADADGRAMTLAPRTFRPGSLKSQHNQAKVQYFVQYLVSNGRERGLARHGREAC